MKMVKRLTQITAGLFLATTVLTAQKHEQSFVDRLMIDVTGAALVPMAVPAGIGGGLGVGLALRDFNFLLGTKVLVAEPGLSQKMILIPTLRTEFKIAVLPNFLTLLPYVDLGAISTKVKMQNGQLSGNESTYYAETGLGAEFIMTHEISIIPRIGVASALLYSGGDSNNHSGAAVSLTARYLFGRNRALEY